MRIKSFLFNEMHMYLIEPELHTEHNKRSCRTIAAAPSLCSIPILERGDDRALVLLVDELLDFLGSQRLHQRLDLGTLLVARAHGDDVDVGRGAVFHEERVLRRNEVRLHRIVRVDDGGIDVIERARHLRGFDFLELEVLLVLRDVMHRRVRARAFPELQKASLFKEQERAAAVRRVVRDRDGRAVRELVELLDLARVDAHRLDVDAAGVRELHFLVLGNEVVEVRQMLEEVRVKLLVVQRDIRLHIVGELDDFQLVSFLFQERLDRLKDLGVRHGCRADLDGLGVAPSAAAREGEDGERERSEDDE